MRLCFSNIGWLAERDADAYAALAARGFAAIELAPTRLWPQQPYGHAAEFGAFAASLQARYGLGVASLQSILNGRDENLFDEAGAAALLAYLEGAAGFAVAAGGANLVFGCPRNRSVPQGKAPDDALPFFRAAAALARARGSVLALEANPPMYGTNFINTTAEAFAFARRCPGLAVNLDVGALLDRGEALAVVAENLDLVNHIHVSEPGLAPILPRPLHRELAALLRQRGYGGFVSAEMKNAGFEEMLAAAEYLWEVFGDD